MTSCHFLCTPAVYSQSTQNGFFWKVGAQGMPELYLVVYLEGICVVRVVLVEQHLGLHND